MSALPEGVVSTAGKNGHDPRDTKVVKWSGFLPVPAIGTVLRSRLSYLFDSNHQPRIEAGEKLTVTGYEVEYGWLYLVCVADDVADSTFVAGSDLEPEGVRKFSGVLP